MSSLSDSSRSGRSNFHQVTTSFLSQPGLPFAGILSAERIERIFARHGELFGVGRTLLDGGDGLVFPRSGVA